MLALKNWRHKLFHLAPKLLKLAEGESDDICMPFIEWAGKNKLVMDWTMHVHLLNWLCDQPSWKAKISLEIKKELLMAAVIRWSLSGLEHIEAKGILLASHHLEKGVALWKSIEIHLPNKLRIMRLQQEFFRWKNGYAIAYEHFNWRDAKWFEIVSF